MRKQFTAFLAVLSLSAFLVGCTSKEQPVSNPVESTVIENAALEETPLEASEEPASPETEEVVEADNEKAKETQAQKTEETEASAEKEPIKESAKPAASNKPAATPSTNSSAQASGNSSSSKPAAKPSTNNSSNTTSQAQSAKPETAVPSQSPEAVPSPSPEVSKEEETALSCSQIFASITKDIELDRQMDADADMLRDFYGIDTSLLEDYCVKMPQMSFQITEIGVFKVKDANNVSSIISGIDQRANNIGQCLYPSLQETFDSRVVVTKGNYILFAIADDAAALSSAFNSLVK